MNRLRTAVAFLLVSLVAVVALSGCGGSGGQRRYVVALPSGQKVIAAHSRTFGLPTSGTAAGRRALALSRSPGLLRAAPTGLMLDTVDAGPPGSGALSGLNPTGVAGYTSGSWPTYGRLAQLFPDRPHVAVMVNTAHDGIATATRSCLDVEPGDASPSQAGGWALRQIRLFPPNGPRGPPCLYANASTMGAVVASLSNARLSRSQYFLWVADWTRSYHLDPGSDCTQYDDTYDGRNIDPSACTLAFLNSAPPPPPGPSPALTRSRIAARGKSLHAFYQRGCRSPVLTSGACGQLAWRVDHFQKLVDTAHGYYPRCFGAHVDKGAAECQIVRPAVAVWSRARAATSKAEGANGCSHKRTATCRVLSARRIYFDKRVQRTLRTSRY